MHVANYNEMQSTGTISTHRQERAEHHSRDGVNIATFDDLPDAEAMRAILENDGIDCHVQDERRLQRFWFAAKPQAGVHVRVPQLLVEQAQARLQANPEAAQLLQRAVHCPSCQSCRVDYPAMTRKNALPALVAQVAVAFGLMQHQCYCESCHYTWNRLAPEKTIKPLTT
jgi:hypothetical protein